MNKHNISLRNKTKTYVFKIKINEEEDGRWSAVVPILPGCNAWGYTKEETLSAIQENTKAYIETLIEDGLPIPGEKEHTIEIINEPAIAVAI